MNEKREQMKKGKPRTGKPVSASRKLAQAHRDKARVPKQKHKEQRMAEFADEARNVLNTPKSDAEHIAERVKKPRHKRSKAKSKHKKTAWWAMPLCVSLGAVLLLLTGFLVNEIHGYAQFLGKKHAVNRTTFYPGVSANSMDLSQFTLEQAMQEFKEKDEQVQKSLDITMRLGDKGWQTNAESLGFTSDYEQVLLEAWAVGRYGTLDERYKVIRSLGDENWRRDFRVQEGMDEQLALGKLAGFANTLSTPVINSQVEHFDEINKTFSFSESRIGRIVEPQELLLSIQRASAVGAKSVDIVRHEVQPEDTAMSLSKTYGEVASATTDATGSSANRIANIRLACDRLNGIRLEPGETFSFNKTLGARTAKKGYRPAPAYENGVTTNQLGGGICQVSTTLFNAVAKADLKVTSRVPHSRPSAYIGLGKDAAVNWPNQDFKFRNNTRYPIYIAAGVSKGRKVTVAIFGQKLPNGIRIELESERTAIIPAGDDKITVDPSLAPGEKVVVESPRKGYRATVYRVYLDANGKRIKREELGKSYYAPAGAIIRVGV